MLPTDGAGRAGRGGASEAGGGAGASSGGALGRRRVSTRAVIAAAGSCSASVDGEPNSRDPPGTGVVGFGEKYEPAAGAVIRGPSAAVEPGCRKTVKGSRGRRESGVGALEESGGGVMESVSLTMSVEVKVLDGLSEGDGRDGSSFGDGVVRGGAEETACGKNSSTTGRRPSSLTVSDGVELPPLKHQQARGSVADLFHAAGVEDGAGESAGPCATFGAEGSPSAAARSVSQGRGGTHRDAKHLYMWRMTCNVNCTVVIIRTS